MLVLRLMDAWYLSYELKNGDRIEVLTNPNQSLAEIGSISRKQVVPSVKLFGTIREEERALAVTLGKKLLEKAAESTIPCPR